MRQRWDSVRHQDVPAAVGSDPAFPNIPPRAARLLTMRSALAGALPPAGSAVAGGASMARGSECFHSPPQTPALLMGPATAAPVSTTNSPPHRAGSVPAFPLSEHPSGGGSAPGWWCHLSVVLQMFVDLRATHCQWWLLLHLDKGDGSWVAPHVGVGHCMAPVIQSRTDLAAHTPHMYAVKSTPGPRTAAAWQATGGVGLFLRGVDWRSDPY